MPPQILSMGVFANEGSGAIAWALVEITRLLSVDHLYTAHATNRTILIGHISM